MRVSFGDGLFIVMPQRPKVSMSVVTTSGLTMETAYLLLALWGACTVEKVFLFAGLPLSLLLRCLEQTARDGSGSASCKCCHLALGRLQGSLGSVPLKSDVSRFTIEH